MTRTPPAPAEAGAAPPHPPLRRAPRRKVVAGVCGGLGRYYDLDPVVFRVVTGVLAVTGGLGLVFYGFAWLLIAADDEDENEARRLVTGRVDGASLIALLMALAGCGLFLSMLGNGSTVSFSLLLILAVSGAAVWSRRRRLVEAHEAVADPVTVHTVAEAPPETKAPPPPESPSWWREPIVKDGTSGPVPLGYLWGPEDGAGVEDAILARPAKSPGAAGKAAPARGPRSMGGAVLLLALVAGGLGTALPWGSQPLGVCLQTGLVCALVVFALGLVAGAFLGRTGAGTVVMTVVTAVLLAGASLIPRQIGTEWIRAQWSPATAADLRPRYELGTGTGTLDLSGLAVPAGRAERTAAEVGAGRLHVVVPRNVTVKVHAQVGLGDLRLPSEPAEDIDVAPDHDVTRTIAPPRGVSPAGTLDLTLEVGLGQVEVSRAGS
ncbi:PspC domain-containing protein [Streptomyces sp. WAC05374]|uniref:PspC domain-containing protein n=1 Tax=Streptomyces sp. WAC05374 TaxID=2487420 RepID=UPI000F86968E|nr:PspC domain-containing protein [Streptomyces sp. WAC05374]RST12098.1 PspC domain-containing protein [Streptomyces sp. WAC05374]TDF37664.1 PspC domain-containing protein [Streptomyces sp. WAC05374]TDF44944.1 PspC domain-containing protein [Streptomyces sp. WAC05374]TDF46253.1 PspC domain-containing protein [Streptomyces sp. WAC05374]